MGENMRVLSRIFYLTIVLIVTSFSLQPRAVFAASSDNDKVGDWEYKIAYQRGFEAVAWALPAISMMGMREANFSLGGGYNTVYIMTQPPTARCYWVNTATGFRYRRMFRREISGRSSPTARTRKLLSTMI